MDLHLELVVLILVRMAIRTGLTEKIFQNRLRILHYILI